MYTDDFIFLEKVVDPKWTGEVDDCFEGILNIEDVDKNLDKLSDLLEREFNIRCEVELSTRNNHGFGASIYPSKEEIENMKIEIIENKGRFEFDKKLTDIAIVLDSGFFGSKDDRILDFTSREATAIILHEVGHKVFNTNKFLKRNMKFLSSAMSSLGYGLYTFLGLSAAPAFLGSILIYCFSKWTFARKEYLKREAKADKLPIKYGRGKELYSAKSKFLNLQMDVQSNSAVKWFVKKFSKMTSMRKEILKKMKEERRNASTKREKELLDAQIEEIERNYVEA